jgi:hypothetical protein
LFLVANARLRRRSCTASLPTPERILAMKTTLAIMFAAIAFSAPAVNHAHADPYDGSTVSQSDGFGGYNSYDTSGNYTHWTPNDNGGEQANDTYGNHLHRDASACCWRVGLPITINRLAAHARQPKSRMIGKPATDRRIETKVTPPRTS